MKTVSVVCEAPLFMEASSSFLGDGTAMYRDCFVPPGALGIVLHSSATTTQQQQGEAPSNIMIHSIKETSRLCHHVSPGDWVVAVDNVDTRYRRPEEVMQMLMARRGHVRKLTICRRTTTTTTTV